MRRGSPASLGYAEGRAIERSIDLTPLGKKRAIRRLGTEELRPRMVTIDRGSCGETGDSAAAHGDTLTAWTARNAFVPSWKL